MSKKSKDFIVKSMIQLLQTNSFDVITISEICDNTQIVRKTFYNNFTSKEDVISYYSKNLLDEYFEKVKKRSSTTTLDAARFFFEFGIQYKPELKIIINNNLYCIFEKEFKLKLPEIHKFFSESEFANASPEDAKYLFSFMAAGAMQILEDWIISNKYKTSEDLTDQYFYILNNLPRIKKDKIY